MDSSAFSPTRELKYFTHDQVALLDPAKIPEHVAIIMDGNRRWAKFQAFQFTEGHRQGADNLLEILKASMELGVRIVTLYAFSTENWKRSKEEVAALLWLLEIYIRKQIPEMVQLGIRFNAIGDLSKFPESVLEAINDAKAATKKCEEMEVVFALNYGARDEMVRAVKSLAQNIEKGVISSEDISEGLISRYLDTAPFPDPDLLIRTGGEFRVSNFLLWQLSYTELYVTSDFWPDFTPSKLLEALLNYQTREKRRGI